MSIAIDDYPHVVGKKLPYNKASFVDRKTELQIVHNKVKQAQEGERIFDPLVNFWGASGMGKSWLLRFLCDRYRYLPSDRLRTKPTFSLFASLKLQENSSYLSTLVSRLAADALAQLALSIPEDLRQSFQLAKDNDGSENVDRFVQAIQKLSKEFVPIILLDDAEEAPKDNNKWVELEQRLLEPLILSGRVLFVVAGKRRVQQWHRFEVRRRVEQKDTHLEVFPRSSVKEQLLNRHYNIPIDLLLPYTGGSPHLVDVLGQFIQQKYTNGNGSPPDKKWFEEHQRDFGQILQAYEDYLLGEVPVQLQHVFQTVAPLRAYRLEALRLMLDEPEAKSDGHHMTTLRQLDQATTLVWWSREHKAYVTDEMVRRVINRRLLLTDRKSYEQLHQKASNMYWQWAENYRETSEDFLIEIWFHAASLYQSHKDKQRLFEELGRTLGFARENLLLDRFMILIQQIGRELELRELLSENAHSYLVQELDRVQSEKAAV